MSYRTKQILLGILVPNAFVISIIAITRYLAPADSTFIISISEFIILPILMGYCSAWFWRNLDLKGWKLMLFACYDTMLAICLSYLVMGEGVICLMIVSPLILIFLGVGLSTGRALIKSDNEKLNVSIVVLLFAVFIWDSTSTHYYQNEVSDTITINAPPAKVWNNVVAFKKIKQKPNFWLFKIGLPSPMETTVDGYYKGAGRKCIFSNGYTFDEKISRYEPGHDLVFDITDQPRDPEIMNHLDLLRGEFVLKDNGDGTTTLTGNSWYKLYVFPTWYYDIWAQSIVRNVHTRVMKHIKELSENKVYK